MFYASFYRRDPTDHKICLFTKLNLTSLAYVKTVETKYVFFGQGTLSGLYTKKYRKSICFTKYQHKSEF